MQHPTTPRRTAGQLNHGSLFHLTFTEQDLFNINEACGDLSLPEKIKRKLMCLRMHQQEVRHGVIAKILNISNNTITSYLKEYRDGGIAATLEDRSYRPSCGASAVGFWGGAEVNGCSNAARCLGAVRNAVAVSLQLLLLMCFRCSLR